MKSPAESKRASGAVAVRPSLPWAKAGVDLFELDKKSFLCTTDYWSNIELDPLQSTSSFSVIQCLKRHFATHGIPQELVTDGGPQFTSDEFRRFSTKWMFKHTFTSRTTLSRTEWPRAELRRQRTCYGRLHKTEQTSG